MKNSNIKPCQLVLRCYAERKGNQWQAFCIDFDLAVQGDAFPEVKRKLEIQIKEYVYDALAGEDKDFAHQLMTRKAPISQWAKWYAHYYMFKLFRTSNKLHKLFREPISLVPAGA